MSKRKERIIAMFKSNPEIDTLLITSDDCGFTEDKVSSAESHEATLSKKRPVKVTRVEYLKEVFDNDELEQNSVLDGSVAAIKEAVKDIDYVEVLEALIVIENKTEAPRKTAIEAIENRIAEITKDTTDVVSDSAVTGNETE